MESCKPGLQCNPVRRSSVALLTALLTHYLQRECIKSELLLCSMADVRMAWLKTGVRRAVEDRRRLES